LYDLQSDRELVRFRMREDCVLTRERVRERKIERERERERDRERG
jgi:hypothetical protein